MAANPFDLHGHVTVVTGGNSGIGKGIAAGLSQVGADVAIWGRTAERNRQAAEELSANGTRVIDVVCDVSDPASVDAAFERTLGELGRIDSCFANAGGVELHSTFADMSLEDFRQILAVNLDGAFLTLQGAARHMIERGEGGSLVGIASLAAVQGMARGEHYAAAKAGVVALTRSCAVELAPHGIRANAILPGWIVTPATEGAFAQESLQRRVLRRIPARRWGKPADFAGPAATSPRRPAPTTPATSSSWMAATACTEAGVTRPTGPFPDCGGRQRRRSCVSRPDVPGPMMRR